MKWKIARLGLWMLVLCFSASLCQADLLPPGGNKNERPRPRPRPEAPVENVADKSVPIVINVDAKATSAKLQIPQKLLPKMQVGQNDAPGSTRTVIAGLALSGAIAGVVLLRGRSRGVRMAAVGALLAAGLFGAVQIVSANAPPPFPRAPKVDVAGSRVAIEIVKAGESITLTLPPGMIPQQVGSEAPLPPAE